MADRCGDASGAQFVEPDIGDFDCQEVRFPEADSICSIQVKGLENAGHRG